MRKLLTLLVCSMLATSQPAMSQYVGTVLGNKGAGTFTLVERQAGYSNTCTTTGATVTFGTSTTSGELIVLEYFTGLTSGAITITDSGSESYTRAWTDLTNIGAHDTIGTAYFAGTASGITSIKITSGSGSLYCGFAVEHWKRSSGTWTVDQTGATSATGVATPWSSPAVTTTFASELLIGSALAYITSGSACTMTATGSWNGKEAPNNYDGGDSILLDQIVTSIQSNIRATGTTGSCTTFGNAGNYPGIITFK
jgi:hypothetical protein